jgi:hypothetical protein
MTDIVERLRTAKFAEEVVHEAADEIERLRSERADDQHRLFLYEAELGRLRKLVS